MVSSGLCPPETAWLVTQIHTHINTFTGGMQPYMQPTGTKPFNNLSVHPLFLLPLHYIHTYPLSNKHIRSCQCSSCWFCFFYCWCLNWNFSHFVLIRSFFPSFHFSLSHIFVEFTIIPCSTVVCMIHKVTYGLWSATGVTHSCFTEIIFVVTDLSHVLPVTGHSVYVALHDFLSLLDLWYVFTWLFIFV